ncbi:MULTISPECIES: SDR family oxidoreductase [Actinosynnema]|uniref:SDR family NAD(P)-dependent oxidoreductase n=1 Tax=Actinosynnema TaxID=40566 RepID=UPI0020A4C401|nr:SDR family oxidoreductase [Actinosynnema pretiosum]MCP2094447.1 NAD(P)-dependent dehydrogenase, short-chain alcohol dehydrogenase family [Actinosynnema pretiosum]
MGQLEGKTAVVTGGGTGIGLASAVRLAQEGAHVFITGRREAALAAAVAEIGEGSATAVRGDVTDPADLDRLYAAVEARGAGLDVVFANAAAASRVPLEKITEADYAAIFDVNVLGVLRTVQKSLPLLNEGASVILNASTAAERGAHSFGLYAASKAAVRTFARTWATELKDRGVRVNAISPGPIATRGLGLLDGLGDEDVDAFHEQLGGAILAGRMGLAEEVAAAVAFLASPGSSFVMGSNLYVDGGENQV